MRYRLATQSSAPGRLVDQADVSACDAADTRRRAGGYTHDVGFQRIARPILRHWGAVALVASLAWLPAGSVEAQTVALPAVPADWVIRAAAPSAAPASGTTAETVRWRAPVFPTAVSTRASAPASTQDAAAAPAYHDYFHALGYSFSRGLFAKEQILPLAIGSGAALAFAPFDREVSDAVRGHADGFGRAGEIIGSPLVIGALSGGLILGSLATDNSRFRGYAFTLSQSLIVATSVTSAVKLAVRRTRPDGENHWSFPSGHAAATFALATVSSHYYGKKAGIPLYALASLVAASRVAYGKHFPTDVIMGATIGYIAGRAAIRGTQHVTIGPSPGAGVSFYLTF